MEPKTSILGLKHLVLSARQWLCGSRCVDEESEINCTLWEELLLTVVSTVGGGQWQRLGQYSLPSFSSPLPLLTVVFNMVACYDHLGVIKNPNVQATNRPIKSESHIGP